jgi:hypothetical protein
MNCDSKMFVALWQVYRDAAPEVVLCEGSKAACWRYITEHHLRRDWRRGEVRLGRVIWEQPRPLDAPRPRATIHPSPCLRGNAP